MNLLLYRDPAGYVPLPEVLQDELFIHKRPSTWKNKTPLMINQMSSLTPRQVSECRDRFELLLLI